MGRPNKPSGFSDKLIENYGSADYFMGFETDNDGSLNRKYPLEKVADYTLKHREMTIGNETKTVGGFITSANNRINQAESTVAALSSSVSSQSTQLVNLNSKVRSNEGNIGELQIDLANNVAALTQMNNKINAIESGPLVAETASQMTNTSKVYVYVGNEENYTNGDWYYYNGRLWVSGGAYNAQGLNLDTTLTVADMAAEGKAVGDAISDLNGALSDAKEDLSELFYDVSPNENGEFIWALRFGYWSVESESLVWHPVTNKRYLSSAHPIKVKNGDVIHIKDGINARFFALFSADGSTWASLINTTNRDVSTSSDGYVMISARKEPSTLAFTDEDVTLFFEKYLTIYRKEQTDNITKRIDNINDVKDIVVNEAAYVQSYVTASASTIENSINIPIEFSASKGETFIIKADFSVTHPEYFSDIKLSVCERYNNTSIGITEYADLSKPIEYTVTKASTTSILFTVIWVKESDSSLTTGYYENFDYRICVAKKNDDLSDVMTESGDTWEV